MVERTQFRAWTEAGCSTLVSPATWKLGWRHFHVDVLKETGAYGLRMKVLDDDNVMEALAVKAESPMAEYNRMTAIVFPPDVVVEGDQIVAVNHERRVERFVEVFEKADRIFMIVRKRCWFVDGVPQLDFRKTSAEKE